MSSRVLEMEKTHIVYKFYEQDFNDAESDKFFLAHKITTIPVIIVFNKGKVVKRYEGVWEIGQVLRGVKTKEKQNSRYPSWLKLW